MIDISGNKYGKLHVLRRSGTKGHDTTWVCKCTCGKTVEVRKSPLISGKKLDCGCGTKKRRSDQNAINISGKSFASLKVKCRSKYYSKHGIALWTCVCKCGSTVDYNSKQLRFGLVKDCGCSTYKRKLTDKQLQFVLGTLLGDGCLVRRRKVSNLLIKQSTKQLSFVKWKYNILKSMSSEIKVVKNGGYGNKLAIFSTFGLLQLSELYDLIYPNSVKTISNEWLNMIDSPLALAVWYMDDGSMSVKNGSTSLHTEGFPREQVEILVEWLRTKWGISCKVGEYRGYCRISILADGRRMLHKIIKPYIIQSMKYKTNCHFDKNKKLEKIKTEKAAA